MPALIEESSLHCRNCPPVPGFDGAKATHGEAPADKEHRRPAAAVAVPAR